MSTNEFTPLELLHSYVDRAWNIFPIETNEKLPVVVSRKVGEDGNPYAVRLRWKDFQQNRVTKAQVTKWYQTYPDCNWAVVCGAISNLVVLDVDGDEGIASLAKNHPEMQSVKTFMQASPHGYHMFFIHPGNDVKSFPILPKVDVKADGGYIVLHPSKIDGEQYRILVDAELVQCPGWIARGEGVRDDPEPEQTAGSEKPKWVSDLILNGSSSGRRNEDAARLVGYFWNKGVGKDIIEQIIAPWAERCKPPFDLRELRVVIRSICSYQQNARSHGVVDPPVMTSSGTGIKYSWHTLKVDIVVSRMQETDRYGLIGDVEVHTNGIPALPHFLYGPSEVSFKDGRAITALIAELEKRMYGPTWRQMISDVARLSISQFSRGENWTLLRDAPRSKAQGFAHKPLLLAKEPTLWFSAGGGLKSYLALALGVMMETGIDLGFGPPLVRNHVAYLDWEWDIGQHARRLDTLVSPEDQERLGVNIVYRNCGGRPLRKQLDELKRLIAEEGVTYVIIDSASPACGRASDNDEIVAFFQSIKQLNVGSLILAHVTKVDRQSSEEVSTAFGGVQWENQARSTWHLRKFQEENSPVVDVVLTHQKINAGNMNAPLAIRFNFPYENDEGGLVSMQMMHMGELPQETLKDGGVNFKDRIKFLLKNRPQSLEQIAESLGTATNTGILYNTLRSMEQQFLTRIIRPVDGNQVEFWALKTQRMAE